MRIWDISPERLCRNHLLGEHRELHAIWSILKGSKSGYSRHPEVLRWKGKIRALHDRHGRLAEEMVKRGYDHRSPLRYDVTIGDGIQTKRVNSIEEQKSILRRKGCGCRL